MARGILLALGLVFLLEIGIAVLRSAWPEYLGPSGWIGSIVLVALLIGLPWLVRPRSLFGPVGASGAARLVRLGGYALLFVLFLLILAMDVAANANVGPNGLQPNFRTVVLGPMIFLGYALAILGLTSRRRPVPPTTLAVGGVSGVAVGLAVYALTPFGGTLDVANPALAAVYYLAILLVALGGPMVAGMLAARRAPVARNRQGVLAGLVTAVIAALLITVFSITTIRLFPNGPGPDSPVEYLIALVLGPGIGALAGACGAAVGRGRQVAAARPRLGASLPLS